MHFEYRQIKNAVSFWESKPADYECKIQLCKSRVIWCEVPLDLSHMGDKNLIKSEPENEPHQQSGMYVTHTCLFLVYIYIIMCIYVYGHRHTYIYRKEKEH